MNMRVMLWAVVGTTAMFFTASALPAENGALPNERLLQQELKQQQIRTTTQRVADQLTAIIEEFDRNGIAGEDVKVLQAIKGVLSQLTAKEMEKVVVFLQQARTASDPN